GLAIGMASGAAALEAFILAFFLAFFFAFLAGAATAGAGAAFFALFFFFWRPLIRPLIFRLRNTCERNDQHFAIHVHAPSRSSLQIAIDCLAIARSLSLAMLAFNPRALVAQRVIRDTLRGRTRSRSCAGACPCTLEIDG